MSNSRFAAIVSSGEFEGRGDEEETDAEHDDAPSLRRVGARRPDVRAGRERREHEEGGLEAEARRAHACARPCCAGAGPEQQECERPEHDQLLVHHHDACELLVVERGDPVGAAVERIERMEGEDENARQHLSCAEHRRTERDPARVGQPAVRPGIDQERPDEHARKHPARVLEVMQPRMEDRVDVEPRDMPDGEIRGPDRERDLRPQEKREDRAHVAVACDRAEDARREHEDEQWAAYGGDHQRDTQVADHHVLKHVHPEQMPFADRVDRRHEPAQYDEEAGRKKRRSLGVGELGPAAAPQAQPAVEKQRDRERCRHDHRERRTPGCVRDDQRAPRARAASRSPCAAPRSCLPRSPGSSGPGRAARSHTPP